MGAMPTDSELVVPRSCRRDAQLAEIVRVCNSAHQDESTSLI